ncbi:HNH endonuclease [Sorangium sp. So ce426]|uniref:HNH endonuclease n=1 Tax=Sorangium sp. So ce426 TaxID=3133312 RepID=UPI003F5B2EB2
MIRLRRRGVKPPADWRETVDAAFPDAAAFWKKARAFERLAEQGAKRKKGFTSYAPEVLPADEKGKPELPPVWRADERVRQAIAGMSHGFCAYCQSPVSSNHPGTKGEEKPPGQVEHFRPKARFPAQAYDWKNYFMACMACNGAKHDRWPAGGYVRPDEGDPGSRFVFAENGEIAAREGDEQARRTVEDFGLTRYWLTQHRGTAIQCHLDFVRRLMRCSGIELQDVLIKRPVAFSEAINQNVRRVWASGRRKRKKPSRGRPWRGR